MLSQLIDSVGDPSKEAWIAVDFDGDSSLPRDFLLGDGSRSRNNFINRPLRTSQTYRVFVRALGQDSVDSLVHSRARTVYMNSWAPLVSCDIYERSAEIFVGQIRIVCEDNSRFNAPGPPNQYSEIPLYYGCIFN